MQKATKVKEHASLKTKSPKSFSISSFLSLKKSVAIKYNSCSCEAM